MIGARARANHDSRAKNHDLESARTMQFENLSLDLRFHARIKVDPQRAWVGWRLLIDRLAGPAAIDRDRRRVVEAGFAREAEFSEAERRFEIGAHEIVPGPTVTAGQGIHVVDAPFERSFQRAS